MNRKTVFRNVLLVAVVLLVIYAFSYFSNDTRDFKTVDTSVAISQLDAKNVESAQIDDREQQVRLWLKNGNDATDGKTQILAKYPASASEQNLRTRSKAPVRTSSTRRSLRRAG